MMSAVKQVEIFLEKTSMKGVPRIFKTDSRGLKALLIVSIIIFFTCCGYQLYIAVSSYLLYPMVTSISEENINIFVSQLRPYTPLPSISLCNLNPLVSDFSSPYAIDFMASYRNRLLDYLHVQNQNSAFGSDTLFENEMYRMYNVFMFGNKEEVQDIATQQDNFILDCYLYVLDVPHMVVGPPCKEKVKISKIVTADMLNCYTIKLPSPNLKMTVVGVIITVYQDNLPIRPPQVLPYNLASDFGSSEGKLKKQSIGKPNSYLSFPSIDIQGTEEGGWGRTPGLMSGGRE